ncbi:MAG: LysM peptidoglycan-binding domain-containing M23 family metallopeptidase [Candidatus Hydrogenedentota bacterium]
MNKYIRYFNIFFIIILLSSCLAYPRFTIQRGGRYHTVRRGETLWRISQIYRISVDTLVKVNHLKDHSNIYTGQKLYIPYEGRIIIIDEGQRDEGSKEKNETPDLMGLKFIWPVDGKISSYFGIGDNGGYHQGIDIQAALGKSVLAAADGFIIYSDVMRGYGNVIMIEHNNSVITVYAHNKKNLANYNTRVKKGEKIAEVGMSGHTTGSHLHFEIRIDGEPVDPLKYLPRHR